MSAMVQASGGSLINDFRVGMPAGSTYTRTGVATAAAVSGLLSTFAADVPQRTDRGLVLEPARTNLILRSTDVSASPWTTFANGGGTVSITANAGVAPDGTTTATRVTVNRAGSGAWAQTNQAFTSTATTYSLGLYVAAYAAGDVGKTITICFYDGGASQVGIVNVVLSSTYAYVPSTASLPGSVNSQLIAGYAPSGGGASTQTGQVQFLASYAQTELGSFTTSPIPTTSATVARGLPTFTEPVPTGITKALLTYADATTTLVTGLTPGGTFDAATAVLGANKGRFLSSEVVTREWQA